nr:apocytochrome b [Rhynchopus humris]
MAYLHMDILLLIEHVGCIYSTTSLLTIMYNAGAAALVMYILQVGSGILMVMMYASTEASFVLLDSIGRDGTYVWVVRVVHSTSASMVFIAMYLHVVRAWCYGITSAVYILVWVLGIVIWLLMMGIGFLGYVLPWGLMSFWALTVITNLITVIPLVGSDILTYCWGGYYISASTLQRVLALHYLLPFVVVALLASHILVLHVYSSGGAYSVPNVEGDADTFIVYYYKDTWLLLSSVTILLTTHLLYPDTLHHPDNYCFVDRYVTPAHIVPEWYFLPFYAMLRSCASKSLGVLLLVAAICVYVLNTMVSTTGRHNPASLHVCILLVLGILGQCTPCYPYVECSALLTLQATIIHVLF